MTVDHRDYALQAFDAAGLPPRPRTAEQALSYISLLLAMLPASEKAGYVGKGGDNIAPLPDGTTVSVSRICYPDRQIYKVMNDAPNGTAQWVDDGLLPTNQTYVPFTGLHITPIPDTHPVPAGDVDHAQLVRIAAAHDQLVLVVEAHRQRMEAINARFDADVASLQRQIDGLSTPAAPAVKKPWWQF